MVLDIQHVIELFVVALLDVDCVDMVVDEVVVDGHKNE